MVEHNTAINSCLYVSTTNVGLNRLIAKPDRLECIPEDFEVSCALGNHVDEGFQALVVVGVCVGIDESRVVFRLGEVLDGFFPLKPTKPL